MKHGSADVVLSHDVAALEGCNHPSATSVSGNPDIRELELHDLSIRAAVELNAIVSFGRAV